MCDMEKMSAYTRIKARFKDLVSGNLYKSANAFADSMKLTPSEKTKLYKALSDKTVPTADTFLEWLEHLGAKIVWPDEDRDMAREVRFVGPRFVSAEDKAAPPANEDYLAVPLADEPVAAGPGLIPEDKIKGWILVWRGHESIRFKTDLVAVQIGEREHSMVPTLHPEDIVLVDRSDRDPSPAGKIMLICEPPPDCGAAIKKVRTQKRDGDVQITFYSDNTRDYPPDTYSLNKDYGGDITRAIAGRVIWAWSDMTRK